MIHRRLQSTSMLASIVVILALAACVSAQCTIEAHRLRFKPQSEGTPFSFFHKEGQVIKIRKFSPLPRIIIQVLDSDGKLSTNLKNAVVRANSSVLLDPNGQEVPVNRGEAHFTALQVQGQERDVVLDFSVIGIDKAKYPVANQPAIRTGQLIAMTALLQPWNITFMDSNSAVRYEFESIEVAANVPIPLISVQLIDNEYNLFRTDNSLTLRNSFINASFAWPPSDVRLVNTMVPVIDGIARFTDLTVSSSSPITGSLPPIIFTLLGVENATLSTGVFKLVQLVDYSHIAFEPEDNSFIYTEGQVLTAVDGVAFPPIRISLRDTMMRVSPALTGVVIRASCQNADLAGDIVGVVDGIATFDQLIFRNMAYDDPRPYTLTFTAGAQQGLKLGGDRLRTGTIFVSTLLETSRWIRFKQNAYDSFLNAQFEDAQVTILSTIRPAVKVQVLDSSNQVQTFSAGDKDRVTVLVKVPTPASPSTGFSCDNRATAGIKELEVDTGGVATFSDLEFKSDFKDTVIRLTFMSCGNKSSPIHGQTLTTGIINVTTTSIKDFDMRFQPYGSSLFSKSGAISFATVNTPLPPIVVEMLDSTKVVDTSSRDIGITVTSQDAVLENNFMRVSRGAAVFRELKVVSEGVSEMVLTFTAGNEVRGAPVAGKQLVTGAITVVSSLTPAFGIRFHNESYIAFEGHIVPVLLPLYDVDGNIAQRYPLPTVRVQILNSDHSEFTDGASGLTNDITIAVQTSSGRLSGSLTQSIVNGTATFDDIALEAASDPVLTFCMESSAASLDSLEGRCVSSGPLTSASFAEAHAGLTILNKSTMNALSLPSVDTSVSRPITIYLNEEFPLGVGLINSEGTFEIKPEVIDLSVRVSTNIGVTPTEAVINKSTGVAYFEKLRFEDAVPVGITPILTFTSELATARLIPITTGMISVIGGGGSDAGEDLIAEILQDFETFSFETWRARICRRLNIEPARLQATRIARGTSAEVKAGGVDEDSLTTLTATWIGTRVNFRLLEPLPTSRTTKSAIDLANILVNLKTDVEETGDLFLRKIYFAASDRSCDFEIFAEQVAGARMCIEARQKEAYCECHVPMFEYMGDRCLGYNDLTEMCLAVLLKRAECKQKVIVDVCEKLEFPDTPRTGLAATGAFLALFLPPIAYMWSNGFFHKLRRPPTHRGTLGKVDNGRDDIMDML